METNGDRRKKIMEQIAKLAALANPESNSFENEMKVAASKISELMDKYSITWAEIHAEQADKQDAEFAKAFDINSTEQSFKGMRAWHWRLARIIASITNTRHYATGSASYGWHFTFFGTDDNTRVASMLYDQWVITIALAARKATDKNYSDLVRKYGNRPRFREWLRFTYPELDTRFFMASWLDGCLSAIATNVREERWAKQQQQTAESNALVIFRRELDVRYEAMAKGMKKANISGSSGYSESGYQAGKAFGSSVRIGSKSVTGSTKQLKG